ncbi:FCD domain-containing protein [Streptomyces sp. NBC_01198]|uniref:FCD domain-containing protein n=1 Tax=Streptomyces sp. NBC_01198 TaxID=2903769 RepID=UPI002E0ED930|nr:hypothetical protein OG702_33430 [Streptomyces sp. NBC_01198]
MPEAVFRIRCGRLSMMYVALALYSPAMPSPTTMRKANSEPELMRTLGVSRNSVREAQGSAGARYCRHSTWHRQVLEAVAARDPDAAAARIAEHFADITARFDRWTGAAGAVAATGPV